MKIIIFNIIFILFTSTLNAQEYKNIKPTFVLYSKGFVNDFVIDKNTIYVANDEGSVEVFNIISKEKIDEIFIDPVLSGRQEWQNSKILSVDRLENQTLIVSSNDTPYRDVWIHDGINLKVLKSRKDKLAIKEARFISKDKILLATLANEMILYNQKDNYKSYSKQTEQSSFEDMVISEDKITFASSSESGQVSIKDVNTGSIISTPAPLNLDKVYQLDYKNGVIITGGQDRRVGVYPKDGKPYYIKSDFLVYSVALSPSGKIGIYASNEQSVLQLFDIKTKEKLNKLVGHYAIPTTIKFYDEKGFFSSGYENKIFYWKIE
jgi:WD40 repeat protein